MNHAVFPHWRRHLPIFVCLSLLASGPASLFAQGLFTTSAEIVCVGNPDIVLQNTDFEARAAGRVAPGISTFHFTGSNQVEISNQSTVSWAFANVRLDNAAGALLDKGATTNTVDIAQDFSFVNGLVDGVTNDVVLAFGNAATSTGASAASYVNGKVSKSGAQDFSFPIGSSTVFQPMDIFNVGSATYIAQYFRGLHPNYPGPSPFYDGVNGIVSACDYWHFDRLSGLGEASIRLTYGPDPCNYVAEPNNLFIARYNGLAWEQPIPEGSGPGSAISPAPGSVPSASDILTYGDFALVSSNADLNVLPIGLLFFSAEARSPDLVVAKWSTASETDNDFFTVERSRDGKTYSAIGRVEGAGQSREHRDYRFEDDAPWVGVSYYRLRQTDFDGNSELFEPSAVFIPEGADFGLDNAYRCDNELCLRYRSLSPYLTVEVLDPTGRTVYANVVENSDGFTRMPVGLARGLYLVRLGNGREQDVAKVFY